MMEQEHQNNGTIEYKSSKIQLTHFEPKSLNERDCFKFKLEYLRKSDVGN